MKSLLIILCLLLVGCSTCPKEDMVFPVRSPCGIGWIHMKKGFFDDPSTKKKTESEYKQFMKEQIQKYKKFLEDREMSKTN